MIFAGCNREPERLGEYNDFDFTDVKDLDELKADQDNSTINDIATMESSPQPIDTKSLFSCSEDQDCIIVKPDKCCSCPLSINKDAKSKISISDDGKSPACEDEFLCGECTSASDLSASCVHGKCIAEKIVQKYAVVDEDTKSKEDLEPEEILVYNAPKIPEGSNFYEITVKGSCQPGTKHNAVYVQYKLSTPANSSFQIREESETDYKTIFSFGPLFGVEKTISICEKCILMDTPIIKPDKKYYLRLESNFKGDITYSGNYLIDTNYNSEIMQIKC
ncbi:hypothetical protein COV93_06805 [Candidatus Woesearchaeota archaeon CG11_big_fil_rev_8_21_14_0_20_43_8]|nr:MAG: hypothetical protein COV93_06805 [Candidatus Woesearchaeota archaeon CG11_big_fil_rev_8_21_14_0_20_43_8]PIO05187.1 MAG: hypothetical protein COT47_05735 [Candidatus Woesearchaeota archaeon CG08_land_8_20_14_0_20_43_7]